MIPPMSNDPTLEWMKGNGIPLTRENYLACNYWEYGTPGFELGVEAEAMIPEEVREKRSRDQADEDE